MLLFEIIRLSDPKFSFYFRGLILLLHLFFLDVLYLPLSWPACLLSCLFSKGAICNSKQGVRVGIHHLWLAHPLYSFVALSPLFFFCFPTWVNAFAHAHTASRIAREGTTRKLLLSITAACDLLTTATCQKRKPESSSRTQQCPVLVRVTQHNTKQNFEKGKRIRKKQNEFPLYPKHSRGASRDIVLFLSRLEFFVERYAGMKEKQKTTWRNRLIPMSSEIQTFLWMNGMINFFYLVLKKTQGSSQLRGATDPAAC